MSGYYAHYAKIEIGSPTVQRCGLRWMIRRDVPEVMAIEDASFDYPWDEMTFVRVLRQKNVIGKVATCDDRVVAFYVYALEKRMLRLLNLAVHPSWRRKGVGRLIVADLVGGASRRRGQIETLVAERSLGAQLFFRACGFRAIAIRRDPFDPPAGDGYLFVHAPFASIAAWYPEAMPQ